MEAVTKVLKLQECSGEECFISRDLFDRLVEEMPPVFRFKLNDGTENLRFPVFSNKVVRVANATD